MTSVLVHAAGSLEIAPSTGADLRGWSALALLGSASRPGPWLFVSTRSRSWLSRGALSEAQFVQIAGHFDGVWPFGADALGGIVIDGDTVADGATDAQLRMVLAESRRAVGERTPFFVVCADGFVPRRLRQWREYGRASATAWLRAAAAIGIEGSAHAVVQLEGRRITEIAGIGRVRGLSSWRCAADSVILQMPASSPDAETLDVMVAAAAREVGGELHVDRVSVRKIGKTAVFLSGSDGGRYIMRVARSPIALSRAQRNFEALEWFRAACPRGVLPAPVPAPVARGRVGCYAYFVETCLPGRSGPSPAAPPGDAAWERPAVEYISALHAATRRPVLFDDGVLERLVRTPLHRVAAACGGVAPGIIERITAACEKSLGGCTLPVVRMHGDFTVTNCLFDEAGRLTGVVDWEVSTAEGLPLLDLLQLMPVPGESSADARWRRFDVWRSFVADPQRLTGDVVLGRYVRAFDIPVAAVPGLVLMQWASHVADRVEARRDDERWMRLRVWQPLESLGRML